MTPPFLNKDSFVLTYFLNKTHLQNTDFCCKKVIHSFALVPSLYLVHFFSGYADQVIQSF